MADRYPVDGKVALVTGAAKGIGFETAKLPTAGASVAILDLARSDAEAAADAIGERTLALDADVSDLAGDGARHQRDRPAFRGLDVVVANAGIAPQARPMSVMGTEMIERVIDVNLHGVWRTVRPGAPAGDRAPGPCRGRRVRIRVPQRDAHCSVRDEQGRRRGARPRAAGRARAPWSERRCRLLRVHRHGHGPRRVRRPDRATGRGGIPELAHEAADPTWPAPRS